MRQWTSIAKAALRGWGALQVLTHFRVTRFSLIVNNYWSAMYIIFCYLHLTKSVFPFCFFIFCPFLFVYLLPIMYLCPCFITLFVMEKLYKTNLTPVSAKALSEVLQRFAVRELDEFHFSLRSCVGIIQLAALLYRLYREHGNFVWLSPWQLKITWLACYKLGSCPWFVHEHKDRVYMFYPYLIFRYPYENFKGKLA